MCISFMVQETGTSAVRKKKKIISKEERLAKRKAKMKAEKKREQIFKPNVATVSLLSTKVCTHIILLSISINSIHGMFLYYQFQVHLSIYKHLGLILEDCRI